MPPTATNDPEAEAEEAEDDKGKLPCSVLTLEAALAVNILLAFSLRNLNLFSPVATWNLRADRVQNLLCFEELPVDQDGGYLNLAASFVDACFVGPSGKVLFESLETLSVSATFACVLELMRASNYARPILTRENITEMKSVMTLGFFVLLPLLDWVFGHAASLSLGMLILMRVKNRSFEERRRRKRAKQERAKRIKARLEELKAKSEEDRDDKDDDDDDDDEGDGADENDDSSVPRVWALLAISYLIFSLISLQALVSHGSSSSSTTYSPRVHHTYAVHLATTSSLVVFIPGAILLHRYYLPVKVPTTSRAPPATGDSDPQTSLFVRPSETEGRGLLARAMRIVSDPRALSHLLIMVCFLLAGSKGFSTHAQGLELMEAVGVRGEHRHDALKLVMGEVLSCTPLRMLFVDYIHLVGAALIFALGFYDSRDSGNVSGGLFVVSSFCGVASAFCLLAAVNEFQLLRDEVAEREVADRRRRLVKLG